MLLLVKATISGFRSISTAEIPLTPFSILIGRNNSGKSNVLRAIRLLLEGTAKDLAVIDRPRLDQA